MIPLLKLCYLLLLAVGLFFTPGVKDGGIWILGLVALFQLGLWAKDKVDPRQLKGIFRRLRIFFVIVSETLISHTLTNVPDDPRVDAAVREVIADHAQDEGRHNAYFASLLKIVWPRLSETQKDEIGPLLPGFILGFLAPDLRQIQGDLEHAGVSARRAEDMLQETYSAQASAATARAAARSTLRHFAEANVFSHGPSADAFYANDLLV